MCKRDKEADKKQERKKEKKHTIMSSALLCIEELSSSFFPHLHPLKQSLSLSKFTGSYYFIIF